jgi:NAD(P)-dependent dehydrogenase (short-subunit alcohol dehydrogenase family)
VPATIDASKLLRPGLLDGVRVLVADAAEIAPAPAAATRDRRERLADAVASACAELGAHVSRWRPGDECTADVDLLVIDGAGPFAGAVEQERDGGGSRAALSACLDGAWEATRAVANAAFIGAGRGGRVVYLAPAPAPAPAGGAAHDAAYADAARAGLENLARTLSIEWARYSITLVAVAPGSQTSAGEVAMVAAFLGSPAGAYYSGCQFDLRGPGAVATGTAPSREAR